MQVLYKKGWLIKVVSWENDGDHRATDWLNITSPKELAWLKHIAPFFQKGSWEKGPNGESNYYVGNMYDPDEEEEARLKEILVDAFELHWPDHLDYLEYKDKFHPTDFLMPYGSSFLGTQDQQWTRDVESFEVFEVDEVSIRPVTS